MQNTTFAVKQESPQLSNHARAFKGQSITNNSTELRQLTIEELAAVAGGPEVVVDDSPG